MQQKPSFGGKCLAGISKQRGKWACSRVPTLLFKTKPGSFLKAGYNFVLLILQTSYNICLALIKTTSQLLTFLNGNANLITWCLISNSGSRRSSNCRLTFFLNGFLKDIFRWEENCLFCCVDENEFLNVVIWRRFTNDGKTEVLAWLRGSEYW